MWSRIASQSRSALGALPSASLLALPLVLYFSTLIISLLMFMNAISDIYFRYPPHVRRRSPHVGAVVVGCGGVGTWVTLGLAMAGVTQFALFDGDNVEPSNLGRLPYPRNWVGKNKAEAVATYIGSIRDVSFMIIRAHASADTLADVARALQRVRAIVWVIDCTDDFYVQRMTHEVARSLNAYWLRAGVNDGFVTVVRSLPWGDTPHDAGYNVVWVGDCLMAAATALRVVFDTAEDDMRADAGDADANNVDTNDTDANNADAGDTDANNADASDADAESELYFDWANALRVSASERAPAASGLTFAQAAALCAAWKWQGPSRSWEHLVLVGGNL